MLEMLAAHGAAATFFLVGEQVVKRPRAGAADRRRRATRSACTATATARTRSCARRGDAPTTSSAGSAAIEDATGTAPRLHRPPYGIYSPASLRIARERGLQPLLWSRWGKDWRKFTTPERIAARAVGGRRGRRRDPAARRRLLQRQALASAHGGGAADRSSQTLKSAELGTVPVRLTADLTHDADGSATMSRAQGGGTPRAGVTPWSDPSTRHDRTHDYCSY